MENYKELLLSVVELLGIEFDSKEDKKEFFNLSTLESLTNYLNNENLLESEETEVILGFIDYEGISDLDIYFELLESMQTVDINKDEFYIEFDGMEFRVINNSAIWDIYKEGIKELTEDCYDLKLDEIPNFVEFTIDWEATAKNCFVDGYGHHFSGYDGSEHETSNFWYFRTN